MKIISLVLVSLMFVACSTPKPVEDKWATELHNKQGYLKAPPHLEEKKGYAKPSEFARCDKITVTNILRSGSHYYVEFSQNDKKFLMSGVGGMKLWSDKAHAHRMFAESLVLGPVDQSIIKQLPFNPKEKISYEGKKTPMKDLMCGNPVTWKGMKKEHFTFVMGYPVSSPSPKPSRSVSSTHSNEYVYEKRSAAPYFNGSFNEEYNPNKTTKYHYYYFKNGKLE